MKRIILTIIAIIMLMLATFNMGKMYAIDNAIITNESRDKDNYIMELDGETYYYWYE